MVTMFKIQNENRAVFEAGENLSRHIRCRRVLTPALVDSFNRNKQYRFRCCDDDGVTYFWGVCNKNDSFAPLDWVGDVYGCTYIEYFNDVSQEWEML